MDGKKIKAYLISAFSLLGVGLVKPVLAVCPVCTIAIAGGIGLSRWLGVDDIVSGVWIGGLIISSIIWFLNWLAKKQIRFKFRGLTVAVLFYLIIIILLYWAGIMGHPYNEFFGIDKLLLGIIGGSLVFLIGHCLSNFLKKRNQGKAFFPFQKLILPISFLVILSAIFYYLIQCGIIK